MVLFFQEKVEVVQEYDIYVHSSFNQFKVPSIIRLKGYVKRKSHSTASFTRQNVFRRDAHTCQYCMKNFSEKELTLDHVIPVSRGGKKTWDNIVTACKSCNQKKANKTLIEAGLSLRTKPFAPQFATAILIERQVTVYPEEWKSFLGLNSA